MQALAHPDLPAGERFLTRLIKRYPLVSFFIFAYTISWTIKIPIALSLWGVIPIPVPPALHYLAAFGPLGAVVIVTLTVENRPGIHRLLRGLTRWRVQSGYVLFVIGAPLVLFSIALILASIMRRNPDLALLGQVDYLPPIGVVPALALWLLTFGLGEEAGWRGFALPRLQTTMSAFSASLLLGILWGFWHLPAFFYRDNYTAMGLLAVPMVVISVTMASMVFTWLYNSTGGSLLMVVLFHALFDFFAATPASGGMAAVVMSGLMVFWAVRVIKVHGHAQLSPGDKVIWQ